MSLVTNVKPTHWRVMSEHSDVTPCVSVKETDKSVSHIPLSINSSGQHYYYDRKPAVRQKRAYPNMRFFDDELAAIDYLASLIIREQEELRQKIFAWQDRLDDLRVVRGELQLRSNGHD